MSPPTQLDTYNEELFLPQPDDGELITRGEHRRAIHLFVRRLQRIESFIWQDELESDGVTVRRRSLSGLMDALDAHLTVLCSIASTVRNVASGVILLGSAALTGLAVLGAFGVYP